MTSRREFLRWMGTGAAMAATRLALPAVAPQDTISLRGSRPNILFIFSDDHALRTIGAYDGSVNKTPHIDRIAREGAIFTRSYCANSICQPSRACILTGKHSHKNGIRDNGDRWNGGQTVFTRLLKRAGYQTALIGKWHMRPHPTTEFDYWKVLSGAGGQGHYYNPDFTGPKGSEQIEGYSTDIITDLTIDWLEKQRDPKKPFLMMCQYKAPHVHRIPSPRHMGLYEDQEIPEPKTLFDDYANRNPHAATAWMEISGLKGTICNITPPRNEIDLSQREFKFLARMTEKQRDDWHKHYDPRNARFQTMQAAGKLDGKAMVHYQYQRFIKDYLRVVAGIDENVGRLLDWLDGSGLAKDTLVIYSSDQGYYTGEHGWAEKRWMYEESLSMPFLARWPGRIQPGSRIDAMIQNIDYAPTFLDLAGAPIPREIQGRSLVPLLAGRRPAGWRRSIYYHYYAHGKHNVPRHYGVRTERYKLIHYYTDDLWELFDLEKDPQEMTNKYDNSQYATVRKELEQELTNLREAYAVPSDAY